MPEIVSTPGVLGGKPRLKDHRISVVDIVELERGGHDVGEIAEQLRITPAEVEAAFEYRDEHPEEIEDLLRKRRKFHEELQEESRAPTA